LAERNVLDRRTFVKGVLAAGATITAAACVAPVTTPAVPAVPVAPPTVVGPSWMHPKSLVRAQPGYGQAHLTWKYGDTVKWLPPEKYPADAAADTLAALPKTKLEWIYYTMLLAKMWEATMKDLQLGGKDTIIGMHKGSGEEAAYVATIAAEAPTDYHFTNMRQHGAYIAKGVTTNELTAGYFGKVTGPSRGYCSYRMMKAPVGYGGSLGPQGAVWSQMSGYGWYFKVKKSGQVCVTCSGDGASHSSYVWPGYRTCANYKLPIVFGITNNFQGVSNPTPTVCAAPYLADYPASLGIPCSVVDGNSVAAVYTAMKEAIDRARAGDGPSVVEMLTFRWYDHSGTAGAKIGVDGAFGLPYRTDDEVRAWLSRDPVVRYANFLKDRGLFTQAELDAQKPKAQKEIDDAVAFARASPVPNGPDGAKGMWPDYVVPANQWFEHVVRTT